MLDVFLTYPVPVGIGLLFLPMIFPIAYWIRYFQRAEKKRPISDEAYRTAIRNFALLGGWSGLLTVLLFVILVLISPPSGTPVSLLAMAAELSVTALVLTLVAALFWALRFVVHGRRLRQRREDTRWNT